MNMISKTQMIPAGRHQDQEPIRHATIGVYELYRKKTASRHGAMQIKGAPVRGFVYDNLFYTIICDELGANCYEVNSTFEEGE